MIIEFIGAPGAGKTTLLPTAIEFLRERGMDARTIVEAARPYAQRTLFGEAVNRLAPPSLRQPLLWQVFYWLSFLARGRFFLNNSRLLRQVLDSQRRRPAEARRHALYWFFHLTGYYEFLRTHAWPDEALVLDEGFVHRVVQLNASDVEEPDPARIAAYVNLLPQPDLVIFLQAPWEVCEGRVRSRGVWAPLRHKSPPEISRYIANAHRVVNLTLGYIKSQDWTVIEVDNAGGTPALAQAELRQKLAMLPAFDRAGSAGGAHSGAGRVPLLLPPRLLHAPRPARVAAFIGSRLRPLDIDPDVIGPVLSRYRLELARPPQNLPIGRRGRNVALTTTAGQQVLKLYRPQWQTETIVYEHSILNRLAGLNFPAPRLVATPQGETFVGEGGRNYALFHFMAGTNYTSTYLLRAHRLRLTAMAGQTLARFHWQLQGFVPEGQHHLGFTSYTGARRRDLAWHIEKVSELKERSRGLGELEKTHADWLVRHSGALLEELARLDERLSAASLPRLIIHGDYGLHNLLFQQRAAPLDFELTCLEWRLTDLVSCLARFRFVGDAYDVESMRCFMEAYQAEYPLSADEWQWLPQVWRFYRLQAAVQYWNSYFETIGPVRKLISARDSVSQAEWALNHQARLLALNPRVSPAVAPGAPPLRRASDPKGL